MFPLKIPGREGEKCGKLKKPLSFTDSLTQPTDTITSKFQVSAMKYIRCIKPLVASYVPEGG